MKKHVAQLWVIIAIMLFSGCTLTTAPSIQDSDLSETFDDADVPEKWQIMNAAFTRESSKNKDNATLMLKYLSNGCAIFEFRLTESGEADVMAFDTIIAGVLIIGENGTGVYETIPDAENMFTIRFSLSDDGQAVDVTHDGTLDISPDGSYLFTDNRIEISDVSAGEILNFLPTAATSLNSSLGAYTVNYPDALISDWFYSVEAVFDDSGAVLAKFLIAKDLSAVFRVDDDIEPVMIFGSAQPMMESFVMSKTEYAPAEGSSDDTDVSIYDGPEYEPRQLVYITLENGSYITPGTSGRLTAVIPADLPYTLTAESADKSVATVDKNSIVTAVGEGETEINCVVACEDGVANISIIVNVVGELEHDEVISE